MTPEEERAVHVTLDTLKELMGLYRAERWIYLLGAIAGLGLGLWATAQVVSKGDLDPTQLGLLFGSSGVLALTGARVAYFLNRSFNLVELVIKKLMGISA